MTALSVDADIQAGTDLLGKSVTDLQEDIVIGRDTITGTLKYVTGYTGFSGDPEEQSGNYIALHADTGDVTVDRIMLSLIGGKHNVPVQLDSDGIALIRVMNTDEMVQFTAYKDGHAQTKIYRLSGLILESEE